MCSGKEKYTQSFFVESCEGKEITLGRLWQNLKLILIKRDWESVWNGLT